MTVTIELPPEIEAGLIAQAQAEGLGVADYLQNLVRKEIAASAREKVESSQPAQKKKSLSELFSVLQGAEIDLSRNPSAGRPVNL